MNDRHGTNIQTDKLVYRLRLMAEAGGMITRDRQRTIIQAADRLEDLDERIAIMTEHGDISFPPDTERIGGD